MPLLGTKHEIPGLFISILQPYTTFGKDGAKLNPEIRNILIV